jgi:uncharacterized protein with von Willebrand factor type A (vWA) domain
MGVDVPVDAAIVYAEALAAIGLERRADVYWAGRATLIHRPEDVPAYDSAFAAFWLGAEPEPPLVHPEAEADAEDAGFGPYSPHEVLRHKDFAAYSHVELAEARRLMADLRLAAALRRSRRLRPARRGAPDVRRTVRRSLQTGGELIRTPRRGPTQQPRRLVLLLDVSASMEPYARALVRFVHAAVTAGRRVEAFTLGTRVTRVTRELRSRDPDAAISAATRRVADWSGGTRLGQGLKAFNDQWGGRGATVVVLSDGWDGGDPLVLAQELARLKRVAHRIVWVNPHKATPGYQPLARGMAAALPYVDDFVEGHSLAALQSLARVIAR